MKARRYFLLVIAACGLFYLFPATFIWRKCTDIDLNSGLLRKRSCLAVFTYGETFVQTPLSTNCTAARGPKLLWKLISVEAYAVKSIPQMKVRVSPAYADTFYQMQELDAIWFAYGIPVSRRRESADGLLAWWRTNADPKSGRKYVEEFRRLSEKGKQ